MSVSTAAFNMDELLKGEGEWQNIQDVVRMAFKAMCDQMTLQDGHIRQMQQYIQSLETEIDKKADIKIIENTAARDKTVVMQVTEKIELMQRALELKADMSYVNESLITKTTKSDVTASVSIQLDKHMEDIRYQVATNSESLSTIKSCVQLHQRDETGGSTTATVIKRMKCLEKEFKHIARVVDSKADIDSTNRCFELKANKSTVAEALNKRSKKTVIEPQIGELREFVARHEAILSQLNMLDPIAKPFSDETFHSKVHKAQQFGVERGLQSNIMNLRKDIERQEDVIDILRERVNINETNNQANTESIKDISNRVSELKKTNEEKSIAPLSKMLKKTQQRLDNVEETCNLMKKQISKLHRLATESKPVPAPQKYDASPLLQRMTTVEGIAQDLKERLNTKKDQYIQLQNKLVKHMDSCVKPAELSSNIERIQACLQKVTDDVDKLMKNMDAVTDIDIWVGQITDKISHTDMHLEDLTKLSTKITQRLQLLNVDCKEVRAQCQSLVSQRQLIPLPSIHGQSPLLTTRVAHAAEKPPQPEVSQRYSCLLREHSELQKQLGTKINKE